QSLSSFFTLNLVAYETEKRASTACAYSLEVFGSPWPSIIRKRKVGTSTSTTSLTDALYRCFSSFRRSILCMDQAPSWARVLLERRLVGCARITARCLWTTFVKKRGLDPATD